MSRHTISNAETLYSGNAYYEAYSKNHGGRRGTELSHLYLVELGAADTADADGFCASQDLTSAGVFSVSGTATAAIAAAALGGVADVPRNIVAAWTTSATLTFTGTDEYGETIVESSAAGTSFTGKKAFKTITDISSDTNITGLTVGTGVVLGLPFAAANAGRIAGVYADGVPETTLTVAAAVTSTATATTGDVRGTVAPNTAPDGSVLFSVLMRVDHTTKALAFGVDQFAG